MKKKATAKAPTYGFNQSSGEDSQQKKADDVTSTPSLNKTDRAIETKQEDNHTVTESSQPTKKRMKVRAQKGKRPLILSDIENETALPVIQQVDNSVPSVQPEINNSVLSVQNVEQEKLIDTPPIVTEAEPVIEPTTKNSSQSLEIVEKTKLPPVKIKIKPIAQSQYELRKRPHETKMEETSISQPLRKRPRKIEPETQNQTQGEVNANRCSLLSIIRIVKETELNGQHIASLKGTPFWLLFDAIISKKLQSDQCRKFDEVVLKIVQSYEEDTEAFTVGSKNIKFTSDHVRLVFGISCGNKEMTETKIKKESTALAKRLEIKESRLSTTTIERKKLQKSMKQQDIDDVVRLLCLYLCVMLLFSNKANSVNWSYVHYMEDLEKVKEYDWASAVSKYLLDSIHKNHRDIKQLKGSSILLLYFLCEHTKLVEVKTANGVPRLLKWKISDLRKSLKGFNHLSQLPGDKVDNTNLEETVEEKKIFGELCAIDGGKREFSGQQQDEEVQPMLTDNDTEATAALVLLGKKEDEICEEEEQQNDEIHVGEEDEICGHHGTEVQVSTEQKENEVQICTEQEKDEVEEIFSNLRGLNDFNSSSYPSLHRDSFHTTQETDSGTTLVPNTLSTEMEQPNDHAMEVIDKLKKQIENLEQEKKKLEIENMEIRQKNEEALQSHKRFLIHV